MLHQRPSVVSYNWKYDTIYIYRYTVKWSYQYQSPPALPCDAERYGQVSPLQNSHSTSQAPTPKWRNGASCGGPSWLPTPSSNPFHNWCILSKSLVTRIYIYIIKILNKCNMRNKINYIMDQFCTTLHIEGVQNWASNLRHGNIVDGCMHCTQDVLWTGSRLAHPLCLTQFGIHTLLLGEACIAAAKTFAHGPNGIRNATLSTCWEHALLG